MEDVGNSLEDHLALDDVQTLGQCRIVLAGLLPALVSEGDGIAQGGVGEGQRGGVGHCTRDVGYAVVNYAVHGIDRLAVRGRVRGLYYQV